MHKENPVNSGFRFHAKLAAARRAKREILQYAGTATVNQTRKNFEAEGFIDRSIQTWPRKRAKYGGKTLQKTGKLKASVKVLSMTATTVRVGSRVPYGILHQEGRGFPRRKWIGHSQPLMMKIGKYAHMKLSRALLQ